jgi:hypothetical protein
MKRTTVLLILLAISSNCFSQVHILDEYIRIGLENNLTLKQKQASYHKSSKPTKRPRGCFYLIYPSMQGTPKLRVEG